MRNVCEGGDCEVGGDCEDGMEEREKVWEERKTPSRPPAW